MEMLDIFITMVAIIILGVQKELNETFETSH